MAASSPGPVNLRTSLTQANIKCPTELAGQTPSDAHWELLERLARQGLDDLPPTSHPK